MKRWLWLAGILTVLITASLTVRLWVVPTLRFFDDNSGRIEAIANLIQIFLWITAGLTALVYFWRYGKWPSEKTKQTVDKKDDGRVNKSVISKEIEGSIIVTGKVKGDVFQIYHKSQGKAILSEPEFEHTLNGYFSWVHKAYKDARLYGLESMQTAKGKPVRELKEVFIPINLRRSQPVREEEVRHKFAKPVDLEKESAAYLELMSKKQAEGQDIKLADIFKFGKRLAIVGGAGCGKTTLLSYLAANLAAAAQGDELPFTLPKGVSTLVPIILPLRYYREYSNICQKSPQERLQHPRHGTLAGFIPWYLRQRSPALDLCEDFFDRLLLGGGCLLMIDGLDEVMNRAERGQVRQQVENLANDIYPGNYLVVTAREAGYRENAVFGDDFVRLDVQPLTDPQIETLVRNWCRQLYADAVEEKTSELMAAVQHINELRTERNLAPLVSTPLMTTMVVSVKWGETELPRERAKLYEAAVRVILQSQYIPEDAARKELVEWGGSWESQRDWLGLLAHAMHKGGKMGAAITEEQARKILAEVLTDASLNKFIEAVRYRGGLFEERAELFQFVHLTFQEFLAARYLAKERDKILQELKQHLTDAWWREVLLLMYGFALMDYAPFATEYLQWLSSLSGDDEMKLAGLELAGSALLEIERPNPQIRKSLAEKLSAGLFNPAAQAPASQRAQAGNTLARLGDPRPEVMTLDQMSFCWVPSGKFVMGSKDDPDAYEDRESLQTEIDLPEFYISRFPITNDQFDQFESAGGYRNPDYWTQAIDAGVWKNGQVKGHYDDKPRNAPHDYGAPYNLDNHPVVGVTWYEALAFALWLSERLSAQAGWQKSRRFGTAKWAVNLPTEAQWEKAARGGLQIPEEPIIAPVANVGARRAVPLRPNPEPKQRYPWGRDADSNLANYSDTGIGATSAVGCFPGGASRYGCEEMSGNIWEWTRSLWGKNWDNPEFKYPYEPLDGRENLEAPKDILRVLRGGAFNLNHRGVRCAFRVRHYPDFGNYYIGFRVVLSP